jgi:hypothetical protein
MYAIDPAPAGEQRNVFCGPFFLEQLIVGPSGIELHVFGGLTISYKEELTAGHVAEEPRWRIESFMNRY